MVLELHILGPGLGLPSIDAECLAAIFYLQQAFHHANSWVLIPSNDFDISPFRKLPALRARDADDDKSDLWIAGYENIVAYLKDIQPTGTIDLDEGLNHSELAESYALACFIRSRGGPLLDLSLYVSSENYNMCTRPVLGDLLHWPGSWIIPYRLREDAERRSGHLGLSGLDIDTAKEQLEKEANEGLASHIPKSLRKPKSTVTSLLGKSAQQTRFRLEAVTEDFMEPLQEKIGSAGKNKGLLGEGLHTVDCLAIAYLTLMQRDQFPQGWLREMLASKYTVLDSWARSQAQNFLGSGGTTTPNVLPWSTPASRTLAHTTTAVIESLVSSIPGLRMGYDWGEVQCGVDGHRRSRSNTQLAYVDKRKRQILYSQILTSTITATSLVAWLLHAGVLSFSRTKTGSRGRNFGEAGLILLGLQ